MSAVGYRFELLCDRHDRAGFRCGEEALDRYFQTQVTQDSRRRIANCFVVIEASSGSLAAYYTLSAASIPLGDFPPDVSRRLPRYPALPAVRIGRLAVDSRFQRRGLGELMLMDAVARTAQDAAAAFALLVEAKTEAVSAFYRRYGFRPIAGSPRILFLPLGAVRKELL